VGPLPRVVYAMTFQIDEEITVRVTRSEADFDRACDSAMTLVLGMFGCNEAGHLNHVEDSQRSCDSVEMKFESYIREASMVGHSHVYTFKARVMRHEHT
jgi:hypothetical protein